MEQSFYFHNCLPEKSEKNILEAISYFFSQLKSLKASSKVEISDSLYIDENTSFFRDKSLSDIIKLIEDRELKKMLYSYLSKSIDINRLYDSSVSLDYDKISFNNRNCLELYVAAMMQFWAASLPLEQELEKDLLSIKLSKESSPDEYVNIDNFFGCNIEYFLKKNPQIFESYDINELQILFRPHKMIYSDEFSKSWGELDITFKKHIIDRFRQAQINGLLFPVKEDEKAVIIKRDKHDKSSSIHELRVTSLNVRVYFDCDQDIIYIGLYGTKTKFIGNGQESDFQNAKRIVQELKSKQNKKN